MYISLSVCVCVDRLDSVGQTVLRRGNRPTANSRWRAEIAPSLCSFLNTYVLMSVNEQGHKTQRGKRRQLPLSQDVSEFLSDMFNIPLSARFPLHRFFIYVYYLMILHNRKHTPDGPVVFGYQCNLVKLRVTCSSFGARIKNVPSVWIKEVIVLK